MKIALKSADGRVFEVVKDEMKQLKLLCTMLDAYEECEMTEPVVLDRVDGGSLAVILEWCQAFPDAEDFEPDLFKFTQAYRKFDYAIGERAFLEQHMERLWTLADAADYLDASRLRYTALQFLEEKISHMLSHQEIGKARALLGLPHSMKGAYRKRTEERFPTLSDISYLAIEELHVDTLSHKETLPRCIEDYVSSESAKLHIRQVACGLHGKSDEQLKIIVAFLRHILCLEKLEMRIGLDQMKALTDGAVENALPRVPVVKLTVAASEPDTRHDPIAVFASVRGFYKAYVGESGTGSLEITFHDVNLPFKDLLEAIGEWFLHYGHLNVKCTVFGLKNCSLEQLDTFVSLNNYQLTESGYKRRHYECKQTEGREMVLRASVSGSWYEPTYILEWTTSRTR